MTATNPNKSNGARTVSGGNSQKSIELYEQFVFTHCRQNESCNGEAGFQMRLRSCDDVGMQDFTARLSYEPPDTQMQNPAGAPRRLAWLRFAKDGKDTHCVLAHSQYLGRDTESRWGNYFTRTIFYNKRVPLKQVLQYWDSPLWDGTDFGDKGIEFSPKFPGFPDKGKQISDQNLQAFLSNEAFPGRVGKLAPYQRRQLLAWTVTACLTAKGVASVQHVYIHAEPWLVVMLLYGAATVLPDAIIRSLTFSTFEKSGQLLRSFSAAGVIGTITDSPESGLHDDFLESQGIIIDTFTQCYRGTSDLVQFEQIAKYVTLVADQEKDTLNRLHTLAALDSQAMIKTPGATLDEAWQLFTEHKNLLSNRQTLSDGDIVAALRRVNGLRLGRLVLSERQPEGSHSDVSVKLQGEFSGLLWTLIREQCIRAPELKSEFEHILKQQATREQHLRQLASQLTASVDAWEQNWQLYQQIDPQHKTEVFNALLTKLVPEAQSRGSEKSVNLKTRINVLHEYCRLNPGTEILPRKLNWLIFLQDSDEVWEFDDAQATAMRLPEEWIGQAMGVSISEDTRTSIVPLLMRRRGDVNREDSSWWKGFRAAYHDEASAEIRKQRLKWIFSIEPDEVVDLFFMLKQGLKFLDSDLEESFIRPLVERYWKKLEVRGLGRFGWMHHFSDIDKVELYLPYLRENAISKEIWNTVFESLGHGLLCEEKEKRKSSIKINEWLRKRPSAFPHETREQLTKINRQCDALSSEQQARRNDQRAKLRRKLNIASAAILLSYVGVFTVSVWGESILRLLVDCWRKLVNMVVT